MAKYVYLSVMLSMIFKRLGQGILVIWGIVSLLFLIFFALGDPTDYLVEDNADEATKQAIRAKYGLDKSVGAQYLTYLNKLSPIGTLDSLDKETVTHLAVFPTTDQAVFAIKVPGLGRSFQSNAPVARLVGQKLEGTLILAGAAILFAGFLGIFLGVIAALNQGKFWDQFILSFSVTGISAPSFFMGVLIAWLFAVKWQAWTGLSVSGYLYEPDIFSMDRRLVLQNLFMPALALGIRPLAVFIQLTRSSMIEALGSDYVRTAKAKGLSSTKIVMNHALRNALNPVLTSLTNWLASLLAGAFFIEYIFSWQGIGKLTIDALTQQDFPIIMGCALFIGIIFVIVNIVTDILYSILDPRVKLA
ncbi:MAG: ABC transporter permease [Bacteroidia bacterium]|nr:ABC transporter permease [Bacteroidia bacterium]